MKLLQPDSLEVAKHARFGLSADRSARPSPRGPFKDCSTAYAHPWLLWTRY